MNFASTSISAFSVTGTTATISGAGTVNGVAGYTFTVTANDGAPDAFGIVIRKPGGAVHYSAASRALTGGAFTLSP